MLTIDGSRGEGGGQLLRSALSLSMVTGRPVRIEQIRAGRRKPGLMRQHLACVRAAQAICGAKVVGDSAGSSCVEFRPGPIRAGSYRFVIGSAGSTMLLLQTILPALLLAEAPSSLELEGGTHNDMAPSSDFIALSFLPLLRQMGAEVTLELKRHGFYPAGGGQLQVQVQPWRERRPLALAEPEAVAWREAVVTSAQLAGHIAQRELGRVQALCNWQSEWCRSEVVTSAGPGNVLSLRLHHRQHATVIERVGRIGIAAEQVASLAVASWRRLVAAGVEVEEHLADQLLVPLVIGAGGTFRTVRPSSHLLSNLEVIRAFSGCSITLDQQATDVWSVAVEGAG